MLENNVKNVKLERILQLMVHVSVLLVDLDPKSPKLLVV